MRRLWEKNENRELKRNLQNKGYDPLRPIENQSSKTGLKKLVSREEGSHKMDQGATWRSSRPSSYDQRVIAICLALAAVISPLYIDRIKETEPEPEEETINISSYLPLLLLILIMSIAVSRYLDRSFTSFDPNWIHRVCGSSTGIIILLLILASVLKFKSS
ncbi:unnamed protein product [Coffea canephora]|uniref:Uncharacterized protein n=2 Tax=Coffea TaxID=13442 RepID=A0A068UYH1_COFCA|nr:unnamed protein product [Coffea canephora]